MDVVSLLLLLDIAETGSITAGAERSAITVSAASQRVSRLERQAGQPLLVRLPRGVKLTEAGELLVARAAAVRRELREADAELAALRSLETGTVRLGSFPTASASLLSDALVTLRRERPGITVQVRSALRTELLSMLRSGELDLALMWSYEWTDAADWVVPVRRLMTDNTVLLVPDSWHRSRFRLAELADQHWIVRGDDHPSVEALLRSCQRAGFTPEIAYRAHDYQEVAAMVAAGIGIAMTPSLAVERVAHDLRTLPLPAADQVPARSIELLAPSRRELAPAAALLAEHLARAADARHQR
ncbi:LysR family transcriptional regulator [Enemella evansiae]|uniref:LysR family transcriptional regulator n=1 Tax=Enemella evansiae TaxID=2016499 RepID=A0A255GP55_9ACTN|nr:LysR family transcriptional regulator [Enemella evansiae]OYO13951.1 LysR family transcriptional regulator [Enemella evansiae]OYO16183.1 LysR family transcriptional regulator [Enemella evansiae]OYO18537.1 LysR family transcriptional regulator [Enemella evansiae]TDO84781.1 DNA-binding transcriptional LysR family regulator [Enemella evansiae]